MNPKPLINLFSILVMFFSISFLFPAVVSIVFKDSGLSIFLSTFLFVFLVGFFGWFFSKGASEDLGQKDGFILVTMFWLVLAVAGSIPFILSGMSYIDSFFESMSGLTTTGATEITGLDSLHESLLIY